MSDDVMLTKQASTNIATAGCLLIKDFTTHLRIRVHFDRHNVDRCEVMIGEPYFLHRYSDAPLEHERGSHESVRGMAGKMHRYRI